MRLITFSVRGTGSPRIGARVARQVLDLAAAAGVAGEPAPPVRMRDLLAAGDSAIERVRKLAAEAYADRAGFAAALLDEREIRYLYDLWMTCSVNGEERMRVNTRDQIWKLPDLLEHSSRYIPIEPGDMFATGAPGGVAVGKPNAAELFLKPGDVVECSIEGVATLRTHIVAPGLVERRANAASFMSGRGKS